MSAPTGEKRPFLARLLERAGDFPEWSSADKCLVVALVVLPTPIWFGMWEYYALTHPSRAPYLDPYFLKLALRIEILGLIPGWLAIAVLALWLRRRSPENRPLALVTTQLFCIGFGLASYYVGHYTTPFGGIVALAGAVLGMLLFDTWLALAGILSFLLVVVLTTLFEQAGILPYAPLFAHAPFEGGRLSTGWVLAFGGPMFAGIGLVAFLTYYIIARWRDRDESLARASAQLSRANEVISRYVPSQLASQVLAGNHAAAEKHERRKLTLFFSDIQGFVEMADQVEPEDLAEMLNEYRSEMILIAERYGGTIDKFVGDAIMIFFGAPVASDDRDHALRAVQMAIEMQERMIRLRKKWADEGFEGSFDIRIGINTGQASIGDFGSRGRMEYTAIGRHVNLAARLQAQCDPGKILISHSTWVLVQEQIPCTPKGEIRVQGVQHPVTVYEVAGGA